MKKLIAIAVAAVMLLALPALAAAPEAFRAEYEGNGRVEIDFRNDVDYENLSIGVTGPLGAAETVTILELDDDELTFSIDNVLPETTYTYTVNGIREGRSGDFGSITGEITTPAAGEVVITELEGEADDGELEIEFLGRVDYDNPTVTVAKADGTILDSRIEERDGDSIELRVQGLIRGEEYTVTVTGIAQRDSGAFGTVSRSFIAR